VSLGGKLHDLSFLKTLMKELVANDYLFICVKSHGQILVEINIS
jgi:hypothetical protein